MTTKPNDPLPPKPGLDPNIEGLASQYLSLRRGKAQWSGPPSLATLTTRILPQKERSGGVGIAQLQARWGEIVGDKIASISQPDIIKGDTLVIKIAAAAAPMLAMRSDEIVGLVVLAGAGKIKKLSFVRAPLKKPILAGKTAPRTKRPLDAQEERELEQKLAHVDTPELKAALKRLADATSDID